MEWKIIDTGEDEARVIMQKDFDLLSALDLEKDPILHFYSWKGNSATYGHFLDPFSFLSEEGVRKTGLSLAKRPTGGGVIFHLGDFAFSALVPATHPAFSENTLENYATVNRRVLAAAEEFLRVKGCVLTETDGEAKEAACAHFCMAKPTRYDVMLEGRKIAGAAQRKTKKGFLHQGSISLFMPSEDFLKTVLRNGEDVIRAMNTYTFSLPGKNPGLSEIAEVRRQIQNLLSKHFRRDNL